jgi:hypothetical protein
MLQRFLIIALTLCSLSATAQWQQTGSKVRYVNGLGIPTRDTAAGVAADSSQILIRPADSSLYIKYKRTWVRVGSGGTIGGSGTTNRVPKFTGATTLGNSSIVDSASAVAMTINPSGNIGIGITNPSVRFHVLVPGNEMRIESTTSSDGFIRYINTSGSMSFGMSGAPTNAMLLYDRTNNHNAYEYLGGASGRHSWYTSNTERMRITSGGNALIGTTTDNGVDRLQVSGSGYFSGSGVIGKFDATGTNDSYIDIQRGGTSQWRLGNNYNGGTKAFQIRDQVNNRNDFTINNSGQIGIGLNSVTSFLGSNSTTEVHDITGLKGFTRFVNYRAAGGNTSGNAFENYLTRTLTPGSFGATISGDQLMSYFVYGSSASNWIYGGSFKYDQNGATSSFVPGIWTFGASSGSTQDIATFRVDGGNDRIQFNTTSTERVRITSSGRVLMGSTLPTDNGTDALQVNGPIQGNGFDQAYLARTTTYTATTSDYFIDCTTGTFTVNLFTAVGNTGRILIIKNSGTGTITVDPNGTQTIDGATTQTLSTQWSRVHIISDGANWKIISN